MVIYGFGDKLLFRYDVNTKTLHAGLYTATPPLGPRAISVSRDGSYFAAGWALMDPSFYDISEFALYSIAQEFRDRLPHIAVAGFTSTPASPTLR